MQHSELSRGISDEVTSVLTGHGASTWATSHDCADTAGMALIAESLSSTGTSEGVTLKLGAGRSCNWADASGVVLVSEFLACCEELLFLGGMLSFTVSLIV